MVMMAVVKKADGCCLCCCTPCEIGGVEGCTCSCWCWSCLWFWCWPFGGCCASCCYKEPWGVAVVNQQQKSNNINVNVVTTQPSNPAPPVPYQQPPYGQPAHPGPPAPYGQPAYPAPPAPTATHRHAPPPPYTACVAQENEAVLNAKWIVYYCFFLFQGQQMIINDLQLSILFSFI